MSAGELADRAALAVEAQAAQDRHPGVGQPIDGPTNNELGDYIDDVSGETLPAGLTHSARVEEIRFMESWHVWDVRPVAECWAATGRAPIGGRWVDHNKGDEQSPNVRSRWVAKDIARWKDDAMFAATPPLEAVRLLLSDLATRRRAHAGHSGNVHEHIGMSAGERRRTGQRKALFIDVRKAHLHAFANRDIYVVLPPEVAEPGKCAKLVRNLYGTRGAPARWEVLYTSTLEVFGFERGRASACCFYRPLRGIRCVVHGDDFTFTGYEEDLSWAQASMEKVFLCQVGGRLGGGAGDVREVRLLNRVIR